MALIMCAFAPFMFLLTTAYRNLARRATRNGMRAMAEVNQAIKETVSGIAIAKNFRQEASIFGIFDAANQQSYRVNVQRGLVLSLVFPTLNAVTGFFVAILVYVGGLNITQGIVTIGAWYLFILSLDSFVTPISNVSAFWAQIQQGLSAAERVFALIDADPNVVQREKRDVPRLKGEVCFEHLGFRYTDKEPILTDFNICVRAGENLALVGHTGAGKSSIAKLIARFYEFQEGRLLIDGMDIRTLDLQQYRRQLGIVSQVPFLFSGTVADNIRYALPSVTEAEMLAMAKRIGDGEWLETLPDGLHTEVGERGNRLSMGQRQLVALMRVLVQQPAIFILDEATASIDPFTEWQIQQALNLILQNSTSILIAHRLSTVKAADRIVVMEKGRIIQEGSHDSLLKQGGHYAELYNTYFRHQSLAYVEQAREMVQKMRREPFLMHELMMLLHDLIVTIKGGQLPQLGFWTYIILALLVAVEGPIATLLGAAAASAGLMRPMPVFLAAAAGNLTADSLWYTLGYLGKTEWILHFGRRLGLRESLDRPSETKHACPCHQSTLPRQVDGQLCDPFARSPPVCCAFRGDAGSRPWSWQRRSGRDR